MTHTLQTLLDALTSPTFAQLSFGACAALMACCGCSHKHDGEDSDGSDDDEEDVQPDFNFNFSAEEMREYEEMVAQTNARIAELVDQLDADGCENAQELEAELIQAYLARAARLQEEGETEAATDDYAAAFDRIACFRDTYGESTETIKQEAAARLNFAILLNDDGEFEDADVEYQKAAEANEKLVALGDGEARLDLNGILLNRASLAFELDRRADSLNMLDEAAEEFQKIADVDVERQPEALFYLAKTLATKADLLRVTLNDDDFESFEATEARETTKRAVDVYRSLVAAGHSEYKRDFADGLVGLVAASPKSTREDVEASLNALGEACRAYESVVACGEHDACVELFDATMQRGELMLQIDRTDEAAALYDGVVETFEQFADSDELPLLEGLAIAYQRRATLRKDKIKVDRLIADLTKAIDLQTRIADSLIETLKEEDEHEGCGCGHEHCHEGCDHDHGCDCGCGHDHDGCGCGHEHEHEGCGCGCGSCGGCGDAERKFLVEKWVADNFNALTECLYERIGAYLEKRDSSKALSDCMVAEALEKAYLAVLREGEPLESEFSGKIRELRAVL